MSFLRPEIMLIKKSRSDKQPEIMDPDCAICSKPAIAQCDCEAQGLDIAVRQAEQRMMSSVFTDIRYIPSYPTPHTPQFNFLMSEFLTSRYRTWVRGHAQDYILSYFTMLTSRRKESHAQLIQRINERAAYYYNARPHPSEIAAADADLKRGIDDDWKASVQRYPEVLEYFYGLVDLNLPSDEEPGVRDPPLSALGGGASGRERKVRVREPPISDRRERTPRRRRSEERKRDTRRERERPVAPPPPPIRVPSRGAGYAGGGYSYGPLY
jgi:hypothetical protein